MRRRSSFRHVLLLLIAVLLTSRLPCNAQNESGISPEYIEREFDWALYVDATDVKHYLNYKGTKLHPVSKVRVKFKLSREKESEVAQPPQLYEELWYHNTTPIGMRRRIAPQVPAGYIGAVVLSNSKGNDQHLAISTNAAVRAIVDFLLKKVPTGVLFAAADDYADVEDALARFGFSEKQLPTAGKQVSITLRSYPPGRDNQLYLRQ